MLRVWPDGSLAGPYGRASQVKAAVTIPPVEALEPKLVELIHQKWRYKIARAPCFAGLIVAVE